MFRIKLTIVIATITNSVVVITVYKENKKRKKKVKGKLIVKSAMIWAFSAKVSKKFIWSLIMSYRRFPFS